MTKRRAYDKAKSTNAPGDWEAYRKLRRSFDRSLRKCRSEHIKTIGDNQMTNNSKPFWKFIKNLRYSSTGVLSLIPQMALQQVPLTKQMLLLINFSPSSLKRIVVTYIL